MDSMRNYRLAVDENGSIDFGYHPVTLPPTVPVNLWSPTFTRPLAVHHRRDEPPSGSNPNC